MKKKIRKLRECFVQTVFALFTIFYCSITSAQNIVNHEFNLWTGTSSSVGSCDYFTEFNLINWFPTGGTPNWIYPGQVHLWGSNLLGTGLGESFAGHYKFYSGVTYTIKVAIVSFDMTHTGQCPDFEKRAQLNIRAANSLIEVTPLGCGTGLQSVPFTTIHTMPRTTGISNYVLEFSFTPTSNWDYIWIFPSTECPGQVDVTLEYVSISNCANGSVVYQYSHEIAGGGVTQKAHIKAGSATPVGMVQTDPTKNTTFIGAGVSLEANFISLQNTGNYFLAIPGACTDTDPDIAIQGEETPCDPIFSHGQLCAGFSMTLSNGTIGGTWSSSNAGIATVNMYSGNVTGISPGTCTISYTYDDCVVSTIVTVVPTMTCGKSQYDSRQTTKEELPDVYVYPIPTTGYLNIRWTGYNSNNVKVVITDVSGRESIYKQLSEKESDQKQCVIDIAPFPSGIYFVELFLNEQHIFKKIIKQ